MRHKTIRGPRLADEPASRRQAAAVLAGVAVLTALLLTGLGVAVWGLVSSSPTAPGDRSVGLDVDGNDATGGDPAVRVEHELVTRPMLTLPAQASLPHALADGGAGPTLLLPRRGATAGLLVPEGFPATPEGGLAQLVELTRAGTTGGDPDIYGAAYAAVSEPGAPAPSSSYVYRQLTDLRSHGGLRRAGPVPGLTITWTPTSGQIKGTATAGSLVVACVLGQLDVDYQGRVVSAGLGDCQAMRRVDGQWRIAVGPAAAEAPSAWPGSAEALAAGYRELR